MDQAEQARAQAAIKQTKAQLAPAELARLQSQLIMLQSNLQDSTPITWWRAEFDLGSPRPCFYQ